MAVSFTNSNVIFDFTPIHINVSYNNDATYELTGADLATIEASHKAQKNVSVNDTWFHQLFQMRTDSVDLNNTSIEDLYFRVNPAKINTLSATNCSDLKFSNFVMTQSTIPATNNDSSTLVEQDFVRRIAYEITGGYNRADIFSNETELVAHVDTLNTSISNSINSLLSNASQWAYLDSPSTTCNVYKVPLSAGSNNVSELASSPVQVTDATTANIYRYLRNLFLKTLNGDNDAFENSGRFTTSNISYENASDNLIHEYTISTYNVSVSDQYAISVEYQSEQTINTTNVSQKYKMTTIIS